MKCVCVGEGGNAFSKAKCDQPVESLDLFSVPASSQPRKFWPQLCPLAMGVLFQMLSACCSGAEEKIQVFITSEAEHPLPNNKIHYTT